MVVREKLVELLNKANSACVGTDCFEGCKFYMENDCLYKLMADVMISHGVTVSDEVEELRADNNRLRDMWAKAVSDLSKGTVQGVTVQEWISVKDKLPEMRDDGFADAFLVTNGSLAHIAYFVDGAWIFTDNGQMKEPMFYDVTHWQYLPQPPKGE